jgi:hypothetical protein
MVILCAFSLGLVVRPVLAETSEEYRKRRRSLDYFAGQKIIEKLGIEELRPRITGDLSLFAAFQWVFESLVKPEVKHENLQAQFDFEKGGKTIYGSCQVKVTFNESLKAEKTEIGGCRYHNRKGEDVPEDLLNSVFAGREYRRIGSFDTMGASVLPQNAGPAVSTSHQLKAPGPGENAQNLPPSGPVEVPAAWPATEVPF